MVTQILERQQFVRQDGVLPYNKITQTYTVSAPTGTGKTITYILASLLNAQLALVNESLDILRYQEAALTTLKRKHQMMSRNDYLLKVHKRFYRRINTLVFVNTPLVGVNAYLEFCKYTNQVVSFIDLVNTE